ncbi:hypothetical protein RR46_07481 [Papilio xuthus]|uniref:Uncharacterized protein n=1 Tax=Papilio xuthus TaxID=66420 RepID=A0A194Q525_PAPXU|nr:hypothetical protein RR46_07481 [Papilio xuthus]
MYISVSTAQEFTCPAAAGAMLPPSVAGDTRGPALWPASAASGGTKAYARAQIRVVNAFRQGLDSRGSLADAALAEALRKQTALAKRFSHASSVDCEPRDALAPHDIDVERLSSHSHTETAV